MEFRIKCHLGYECWGPASFLFNVAVARNSFQRIITEHFEVEGAGFCQEMVIGGQRYHRVTRAKRPSRANIRGGGGRHT
jgi:transglutaminase superfamily protein